jgi:membrane fusion protein (multidrug efflux system)
MNMVRYGVAIVGLLVLVGALAGIKGTQISGLIKAGEAFAKEGPPPESVSTDFARTFTWERTLSAIGTITTDRGVAVSNDAAGIVKRIAFESGGMAKEGQVLIELDNGVERAQLRTAQARKELAEQNMERTKSLFASGGVSRSQLDADESQLKSASAEVAGLEAQIARKVVRAPFAGRLGIRAVNLGQYLSPGTMVTTLEALESVYVDFTLPQQASGEISVGTPVRVGVSGVEKLEAAGAVAAVDPSLDRATRSLRIRATLPNPEQKLRPGMFAEVKVVLPDTQEVVAIPLTAVVHAPYGDSVFLVEDGHAEGEKAKAQTAAKSAGPLHVRQQFVRLGEERGDYVAVLEGVKAKDPLVSAGAFKLRNGAKITVHNEVKPEPKLAPHPENR